ncbi:MAG: HEAT repeat domain-containing protein [Planctomycetes bacterium]|nr:HEAT repeat domain-containing protein [Planctomycetota bacterium]
MARRDLVADLRDVRVRVRKEAIREVALKRVRSAANEVALRLRDDSPRVRDLACWALGTMGTRAHAARIARRLRDPDGWTRCHAAEALGWLRARRFAPTIARLLADHNWLVRGHAVLALGDLRSLRHGRRIAEMLDDPHPGVRAPAAMALAMLGRRHRLPEIVRLLDSPRSLTGAVTALNILRDHPLYRKLRSRRIRAAQGDTLRSLLARAGVRFGATRAGRRWLGRPFMKYRAVAGYDIYGILWDVAADFGPGRMGYVVRKGRFVIADMDEAVAELSRDAYSSRSM